MSDRERRPAKTLNGRLFDEGFVAVNLIEDSKLAKRLHSEIIDYAIGKYTELKIVPGDVALEGISRKLREPAHIVYAKINKKHESYRPDSIYVISASFEEGPIPLHCIR